MRDINEHTPGEDLIIKTAVRLMVPFAQLFGLYVIVHGHYSPGGGFQGGVILGAAFIMLALAFDVKTSQQYMTIRVNTVFNNLGAAIFAESAPSLPFSADCFSTTVPRPV